ncbi:hypothetical protein [Halobaculum sp. P14]|uniref:hypothetical protein n=1 Tax=Halobaculum sp. P14 TaxID=3421638 RepID=UPI003EBAF90A
MQWRADLPDSWDDAPADPPQVETPPSRIVPTESGFVFEPTSALDRVDAAARSAFSTLASPVGRTAVERDRTVAAGDDDSD